MAGRPKTMAKRVGVLEEQAVWLSLEVFKARPSQYREKPDAGDPINAAWNDAMEIAHMASICLERLGDLLRKKAGITEPGPTKCFFEAGDAIFGVESNEMNDEEPTAAVEPR